MTLPSFTLTSAAATGTYPFSIGIGLKKGDATSIACNLSAYQVVVKRTWNDGSIKHAIISGRAVLTSGVPRTVTIASGAPQTGAALTSTDIEAAAPSASVQCGALGTVSLSTLLSGAPFRTWISGHEMVECHYRAAVGGGTLLDVWFHVRLFADGRMWVRVCVENGFLDNGAGAAASNADRSYVPTVIIGGVTVYDNGGGALLHRALAAWTAEGWIGGNPQVTPLHDVANLRASKLVPNYSHTAPSSGTLDALVQTYVPMGRADIKASMGDTGYAPHIGLLPLWDALYCTSGDARAMRALLTGSSSLRSYPIGYRGNVSKQAIKPSSFTNWGVGGPGAGGTDQLGNASLTWEYNHAPSGGYLAYLLTGDYWHYETMLLQASVHYLCVDAGLHGTSVNRVLRRQVRGIGWALRTIGQLCAIAPDIEIAGGQIVADYRSLLANNYAAHKASIDANGTMIWSGSVYQYSYGDWAGTGSVAPWMLDYWVQSNGHISDLEPLADATNLTAVRNWMYRWTVGRLGRSGVSAEFDFTRAGTYGVVAATSNGPNPTWHQSWGAIHTATFGSDNTVATNTLQGSSSSAPSAAAAGYWGYLLPALAYAVDHGASGAAAAWARLTGATNWSTVQSAGFDAIPIFGVAPRSGLAATRTATYSVPSGATGYIGRSAPPSELPYTLPSAGQLKSIHLNSLTSIDPCPSGTCWYSQDDGINAPWVAWCTGVYMPAASTHGKRRHWGGGHNASESITFADFDYATGLWSRAGVENPGSDWTGALDTTWCDGLISGSRVPPSSHTYNLPQALDPSTPGVGPEGGWVLPFNVYGPNAQPVSGNAQPHFATAAGVWSRLTSNTLNMAGVTGFGGSFIDRKRNVLWLTPGTESNTCAKIDLTQVTKTLVSVTSFYSGGYYAKWVNCPDEDFTLVAWCDSGQTLVKYKLFNMSTGSPVHQGPTIVGTLNLSGSGFGIDWCPLTKKFYIYDGKGSTTVHTLTPPADPANWTAGNWTYGSETMTGETPVNATEHTPGAQGGQAFGHWGWISSINRFAWCQGACMRASPDGVTRDGAMQLWCPAGVT